MGKIKRKKSEKIMSEDFKKASEESEIDRLVSQKASLMGRCYDAVKGIIGKEDESLEGREHGLVSTLFIQTNDELATPKQKSYIRDLVKKKKIDKDVLDKLDQMPKDKASKLIGDNKGDY